MLSIKKTLTNLLTSVLALTTTVNNLDAYTRSSIAVVSTYARTSGQTFTIEKVGNIATIKIVAITALPGQQDVTVATLPNEYKPAVQILKFLFSPTTAGADNAVRITINTNGTVNAYWYGASGSTSGNINIGEYISYIRAK